MHGVVLGQYVKGDSYLYRLDPRSKILATILFMVSIFFLKSILEVSIALGVIILIIISGRINLFKALKGMKALLLLSTFIFVFQILFNKTGEVIYAQDLKFNVASIVMVVVLMAVFILLNRVIHLPFIWFIIWLALSYLSLIYDIYPSSFYVYTLKIYEKGLNTSIFVFIRLVAIVMLATILTLTTKPTDLTLGIEKLLKFLKIFKINPEEIALIISIALRYIPTILDEAFKIMDAQAARGADYKSGNIFKRIKILVSLLVPMFVISFERSDELADAMLSRNFVPGKPKTKYHILKWSLLDTIFLSLSLVALGGSICLFIIL